MSDDMNKENIEGVSFNWKSGTHPISVGDPLFVENRIDEISDILIATDGKNKVFPVYLGTTIVRALKVDDNGDLIEGEKPLSEGEFIYIADEMKAPEFIVRDIVSALIVFKVTHCPVAVYMNDDNLFDVLERFPEAKVITGAEDEEIVEAVPDRVIEISRHGDNYNEMKLFSGREFSNVKDYYLAGGDINIMLKTKKPTRMCPLWWMQKRMKSPSWIINDMIPASPSLVTVFSPANVGKTYFALAAGLTIATGGGDFYGHKARGGKVLYLCGEGDSGIFARIQCWLEQHKIEDVSKVLFYFDNVPFSFDEEGGYSEFTKALRENFRSKKPDLIIVDTLNLFMLGDENSTQEASTFIKILKEFTSNYRCSVMLVHHTGVKEEGRGRGSSAFRGAIDSEIKISNKNGIRIVEQTKNRNGKYFEDIYLMLEEHEVKAYKDIEGKVVTDCVLVDVEKAPEEETFSKWERFIIEFCVDRALNGEDKLMFSRSELIAYGKLKWPEDADKMSTLFNEKQKNKALWTLLRDEVLARAEDDSLGEDETSVMSKSEEMNKKYTVVNSRIIEEIERQVSESSE